MNKIQLIKRIYKTQIKKYIPELLVVLIFMVITAAATASVAWLLDPAIKKIFIEKDKTMLVIIPFGIVLAFCIKAISLYITRIKSIQISFKVKESIQKTLAEKILSSDTSYLLDHHSGKFISNFTADTGILQSFTQGVALNSLKEFITLIFLMSLMFSKDIYLSLLAISIIPFAAIVSKKLGKRMGKAVHGALEANEDFTKYISEILKSTSLIKIFQRENSELINLSDKIKNWIYKSMKVEKTRLGSAPLMETITGVAVAIVVFAGGYRSVNGQLEIGAFFSFLTALMMAYQPVRALAGINIGLNEGLTAAKRIYKILDNKVSIEDSLDAKNLENPLGDIEFKNVSMEYIKNTPILKNINFKIPGKSRIALVGPSGGGKSTIINMLPRFYDATDGEITIGNQKIKNIKIQSLRNSMALVSQETILFDDTIKNNILYGKINASDEEVINACKNANCHQFIESFKNGYNTLVGENGVKLSGGQKQRVSIARAILKNSSIVLLDEATSALDTESEKLVQEALNNLAKNKTTITIAHRLSTVKNSDLIFVIKDGEILQSGDHNQLINQDGLYKKLCDQQSL
jgi:subfamily B ATP-binding cassette protein MsbA